MASEERIPNAAAAPASAPTVAGAAAAAAPETSSTAGTSGKTKSGGGGSSSNNNNKGNNSGQVQGQQSQAQGRHHQGGQHKHQHQHQQRRKGSKQHQHQHQNQRQHKGGQYNNQHQHQNQHQNQNQHQYQHHNRPGAYVPVSARPMTPPALSMQNPPPPLDLAARRSGLLQALTPQLEYYFSPANLAGDTYLRTLMDLNSGYVPVAAVATFGNVQRIVMRWDGGIPPTAATSPNPEDPPGGPLVRSERDGVAAFVAAAARQSRLLDVVEIDAEGKKVVEAAGSGGKAKDLGEGEAGKEKDGSRGNGGMDQGARSFAADARIAIGPVGGGGGAPSKTTATARGSSAAKGAPPAPIQTAPDQTTIILRDAPAATTEKDIRSVFTAAKTEVANVRLDVGNTWFVSLDAKTASRDDVVSLLLSLRGMKLRGEPIKARLKTESAVARQGSGGIGGGFGYAASAPQSPVTGRPGQFQQHDAGSMAVTGNRAGQQGRGSGGGTRPPHMQQSHSVPSSPMAGGAITHYGGGKAGGKGGKNIVALNSGVGNKSRRGSRGGKDGGGKPAGSAVSSGTVSSPKQAGAAARASPNIPPPPLAGLHFPALGGDNSGDKKPDSQLHHRPKGAAPPKDTEEAKGKESDLSKDARTETQPAAPKPSTGGYAAALRKAAPAASAIIGSADEKKTTTASAAAGSDGKALKLPPSTGGKGPSSKLSKSTTLTDDSSADDKSSVSSKPESIESHPAITPVAPSWGGGNTFADILKKKQAAAAAATTGAAAAAAAEKKSDDTTTE